MISGNSFYELSERQAEGDAEVIFLNVPVI
jgi:hypothetical protein